MATSADDRLIEHLRRMLLYGHNSPFSDGDLLGRFVQRRDDAAFEALVRRHGSMVFGVCHRVLRHRQDAEDAFQATFLVLARKAARIAPPEMLGNWLYGVAHQTAIRARTTLGKRNQREQQVPALPETPTLMTERHDDLWRLLDQEVSRLPDKYRAPIVLCDLEGKTRKEAARHLGWPEGSVAGRLARGREMLAARLAKHGPTLSIGALAAELAQNAASACAPASVLMDTIKAASLIAAGQTATTAGISVQVATLAEGMIRIMNVTKWATTTLVILVLAGLGGGLGMGGYQFLQSGSPAPQEKAVAADDQPNAKGNPADVAKPMTDKEQIVGVWRVLATESYGQNHPASGPARHQFTKDGAWTYFRKSPPFRDPEDFTSDSGSYEFVGPGQIDLIAKRITEQGIYRFDGNNRLTICFSWGEDNVRPSEFVTEKGQEWRNMLHLVRAMPGEETPSAREFDKSWLAWQKLAGVAKEERPTGLVIRENLREVALAFHSYQTEHRSFPSHAIYSADGKTPLLSWRVALLPFLEQKDLYDQFKLGEPWDSEHNKKLIPKMPKVYESPVAANDQPGRTFYQVVIGTGTAFDGPRPIRVRDIADGTSFTVLAIEAKDPVIWTAPVDLKLPDDKYDRLPVGDRYHSGFNDLLAKGFNAALFDGSVRFLPATIPAETLRAIITPSGREIMNFDKLSAPTKD